MLGAVDVVAAEDTRRAGKLLHYIGIAPRLVALHDHNEDVESDKLVARLANGEDVALISDAGTPLVSDPGLRLVSAARASGIAVVAVPGPSAVTAALSIMGIATDRFAFEGFLPRKSAQRRSRLALLKDERRTMVFFEARHRIEAVLGDMVEAFGPARQAGIARELTKLHEEVALGTLEELARGLGSAMTLAGEFVIVVAGADVQASADDDEVRRIYGLLLTELPPNKAVALCARITGRSRNDVYALVRA